jgi:membrane protein YqaA with SNARE-associated domain
MFGWFFVTLGVAFGSALVPLINVEVFVLGLVASQPGAHWLVIGAAVAIGQMAGKLFYYLAARGSIRLPAFLGDRMHRERPLTPRRVRMRLRTKWIRTKVEALRERCHRHPAWMTGTYGVSAVLGLPPFMATTVLAGLADMPMSTFVGVGLAGRFVRYSLLAACPAIFNAWLHHHW